MTTSYKIKLQEDLKAMKRLERAAERAAAEAAEIETAARKRRATPESHKNCPACQAKPLLSRSLIQNLRLSKSRRSKKNRKEERRKKAPAKKATTKRAKNDNQGYEQGRKGRFADQNHQDNTYQPRAGATHRWRTSSRD